MLAGRDPEHGPTSLFVTHAEIPNLSALKSKLSDCYVCRISPEGFEKFKNVFIYAILTRSRVPDE